MLIKFWLGVVLSIALAVLCIYLLSQITKRLKGNGATGGLVGFLLGAVLVILILVLPGRMYIVTGDAEYVHYMVFGSPEYEMESGEKLKLIMNYNQCCVVNETDKPVVIEEVVYGGYGFGGDTDWVEPGKAEFMPDHRIFYFFDDGPPDEIMVNDDSEETIRLWLRKRRE